MLGVIQSNNLFIFKGQLKGRICLSKKQKTDSFEFDSAFVPDGCSKSLFEFEKIGKKNLFSSRRKAISNLIHKNYYKIINVSSIPEWTGPYQNE